MRAIKKQSKKEIDTVTSKTNLVIFLRCYCRLFQFSFV